METFGFEVAETALAMRRDFDRRAANLGVTRAQWRVLVRLMDTDGLRQVEIAEALDVEPITLCRMIDRLEESGLVERRRNELDRRAWNIHLTNKATPVIDELHALASQFHEDALMGISEADQKQAMAVLAQVRNNLSRGSGSAARKAS